MDKTKQQYLTLVFGNLAIISATCLVTIYTVLSSLRIIVQRLKDISITGNMTMVDRGETLVQGYPISDYLGGIVSMVVALYLTTIMIKIFICISNSEISKMKNDVQKVVIFLFSIALLCLWSKEDFSDVVPIIYSWICLLFIKEILKMTMTKIKQSIRNDSNFEGFFDFDKIRFKKADYYLSNSWKNWLVPLKIEKRNEAYTAQQIVHPDLRRKIIWDVPSINGWGVVKFRLKNTPFIIEFHNSPPEHIEYTGDLCGHSQVIEERTGKND